MFRFEAKRGRRRASLSARALFCALLACFLAPLPVSAQSIRTDNVETELHSARAAIAPGERFTLVLRQRIREHWHTYWRNPGAAGEATEITWRLPQGFSAGDILWPAPTAIAFETLINYGYSDEVLLPVEMIAPANLPVGQAVTLAADVTWVVCSDICVFEEGALSLSLPVERAGRDDAVWGPRVGAALAALPAPFDPAGPMQARISPGEPAILSLALAGARLNQPYFFPYDRDAIDPSAPQNPSVGAGGASLELTAGAGGELGRARLGGVLTFRDTGGVAHAAEVFAEPGPPLPGTARAGGLETPGLGGVALAAALGAALLGGLILNIMPCVLPVLSVKALSFAGGAHGGQARRHGLLYAAGVLATFLALAGLLIALRGAGAAVGWGFQLQAPWVNAGLALLFFAIGLNLLGVFQIGGVENAGAGLANRGGDAGAFFTGALAVVAATPCTAPFMAGAIGAVLTQSVGTTLLVFTALALGFALPLTALSFAPGLQRLIPKPGPWMERAKHVLAFPMFAAAIWLAWVLTQQTGADGVAALLVLALALGFVLFVGRWGHGWLIVGAVGLVAIAAFAWRPLAGAAHETALAAEPWSPARVAELRAEGRPVLVNFTAAWCVTCKLNEATSLGRPGVAQAFAAHDAVYLIADWTNRDAAIAEALAEHGRAGVPLYLYYPPGGQAIILPQVLSERLIVQMLEGDPS